MHLVSYMRRSAKILIWIKKGSSKKKFLERHAY